MGTFYLGIHHPDWLERVTVPCFVSHRRLRDRMSLPRSRAPWCLDSGGFTQLDQQGRWEETPRAYAKAVRRYFECIGNLQWAAVQDWMCEPKIQTKTGHGITVHQMLTVQSYMDLMDADPDLPWAPVLQGLHIHHYLNHLELYERRGLDVREAPACGVGSICTRQATTESVEILRVLRDEAGVYNLHGFGFKMQGVKEARCYLNSADSMAWSWNGRQEGLQNSLPAALAWRKRLLEKTGWIDWNDQDDTIRTLQMPPTLLETA